MARAPKKPKIPQKPKEIGFDFIKSNFFRVIHADGAFGGLTPNGNIHMGIYSERMPFPQKIVHSLESAPAGQQKLGPEIMDRREGRKAAIRELEVGIVLNIAQAIVLRKWIDDRIKQYQQLIGPLPATEDTVPAKEDMKTQDGGAKTNGRGKKNK
jgi:hypothetical protein